MDYKVVSARKVKQFTDNFPDTKDVHHTVKQVKKKVFSPDMGIYNTGDRGGTIPRQRRKSSALKYQFREEEMSGTVRLKPRISKKTPNIVHIKTNSSRVHDLIRAAEEMY